MHGNARIGGAGARPNGGAAPPPWARRKGSVERLACAAAAAVLRRRAVLVVVPLLYMVAMVVLIGVWNLDSGPVRVGVAILRRRAPPPPGSVYRSTQVFEKLWPYMQGDVNRSNALTSAWHRKAGHRWKPCTNKRLKQTELPPSNGFLIIEANGGLNQQRLSICDAVAVAGLLNATLVIPMFHLNSVWRDSSKFGDIFDEEYFIESLKDDVRVVRELPGDVLQQYDHNISNIPNMRTKAFSSKAYYLQKVLPKLLELGAVRIAPFSNRLAHSVPPNVQRLRCLTNYEALRFSGPIRTLAEKMVDRMVKNSSMSGGKYVSVHLRFEEVGMMLRGMGFDNTTSLYVASGKIYYAKKYMAPLRQLFPLLETKDTLASADELAPFKGYSSRLAALDYTICAHSEVFVTTQGGNFPHFLMGHRRYLYEGHSRTIKPDKRKLVLFLDNPNIRWDRFKRHMQDMLHHSDVKGVGLRKPDASAYTFPMPDCMCQQGHA